MATLNGRLNHVAFIIPTGRHFLNRLRKAETKADKYRSTKLTNEAKQDLELWIKLLHRANAGISINNVVFRRPTSLGLSDAGEIAVGGYSPQTGILWRHIFTKEEQVAFTLNTKEYIGSVINSALQLESDDSPFPCVLNLSDSSSTVAWMYKSNHDPEACPVHNAIARTHAENITRHNACDYSQHIAGSKNIIADILSRDIHFSDHEILSLLHAINPPLMPQNPRIVTLSNHHTSWIAGLAQLAPKKRELSWKHIPSTYAAGVSGWSFCEKSGLLIPTWTTSIPSIDRDSSAPSWITSDEDTSTEDPIPLRAVPRDRPSTMWQRPSFRVVGKTPD